MSHKSWLTLAGFTVALSFILLAGIFIFPPCSSCVETAVGGCVPMKCYWTFRGEIPVAILLILVSAGQFFLKETKLRRIAALFVMAISVVGIAITTNAVIGLCMKAEMACHTTALFCRTIYGLVILAAGIQLCKAGNAPHKKTF